MPDNGYDKQVCNTLTVLRDGQIVTHFIKKDYDDEAIKTSMIGREMQGDYYRGDQEASRQDRRWLCFQGP